MITSTLRRLALATGAMVFLALTLTAARPQAQTADHPPTCGGRDQVPCTVFSVFWNENFGVCDRGLKVDFFANRCINSTRRQGKGTEFRNSWTGRALRIQQDQLGWETPLGDVPLLMARHAYQNEADGYAGSAQLYSMTELLDAGVRALRLEVHASVNDSVLTGTYPKMCFSMATAVGPLEDQGHSGCVITDRWFANGLREIRDWMVEPGHERDVVTLVVDMRMEENPIYGSVYDLTKVLTPLREYFKNDSRIGLLDVDESGLSFFGPLPSRAWMLQHGKRVVVLSSSNKKDNHLTDVEPVKWDGSVWRYPLGFGLNELTKPYPDCRVALITDVIKGRTSTTPIRLTEGRTWMLDGEDFGPTDVLQNDIANGGASHYPTYRAPTAAELRNVMKCNVGFIGLNRLLDPAFDPDRVRGMIWSWADDEPIGAGPGNGARLFASDGRWRVRGISEFAPFACRMGDGTWTLAAGPGALPDGVSACTAAGGSFEPPRNGRENEFARAAIAAAGKADAWVNYVALGADQWTTANTPHIVAWDMGNLGGVFEGVNSLFALAWSVAATSVDWDFGDGTPVVTTQGSNIFPSLTQHTFATYGVYTVTARIHVGASETTISRAFTVRQQSDLPFGPQIALDSAPANPVRGGVLTLGVTSWWPFAGVRCRPGAAITPPPGPEIFSWIIDGKPRYVTSFTCPTTPADSPTLDIEVLAAFPDPSTGQPVVDPSTGQFATMGKHFIFNLPNAAPVITAFTGPANPTVATQASYALTVSDAPGEHLTVTVSWPSGIGTEVFNVGPGVLNLSHIFTVAHAAPQNIRVAVSDGQATTEQTFQVTVAPKPVEIVSKAGPASVEASPTVSRRFEMIVRAFGGATIVGLSGECGTGVRSGGPSFISENPDGTDNYSMLCRFSTPGPTAVSITFTDSFGLKSLGSFDVTVTPAPDTTAPVITATPPAPVEATGPLTPVTFSASATDNVDGSVPVSCDKASGSGFPVGQTTVTCSAKDAANNPASKQFDVTVTDTTGPAVTVPLPIGREATSGAGAPATFTVSASDLVDGAGPVTCDYASGATFPLGVTTVKCSATDTRNNISAPASFTVTIADTTAPVVSVPAPIAGEATSSAGRVVTFTVSAIDAVDGAPRVTCDQASGATFPRGVTTVKCTAADAHNNTSAPASFTVTIADTTAPVFGAVAPVVVDATSSQGAAVTYAAPQATDAVSGVLSSTCNPPSGSAFGLGTTTVGCTVKDDAGNEARTSFTVTVRDAQQQVVALQTAVAGVGPGKSLKGHADAAAKAIAAGNTAGAIVALTDFINHVRAQSGKSIPAAQAAALIAQAQAAIAALR